MKILIVGSGGREHALAWKIADSPSSSEVLVAPGNAGISQTARCVDVGSDDVEGLVALAKSEKIDLVVVGPEGPLVAGLVDRLEAEGIRAFGPSAKAAALEGSKVFSKEFMARHQIPTAAFSVHETLYSANAELEKRNGPCVIKADGLAAGKGVVVCKSVSQAKQAAQEMLQEKRFGDAGVRIIIEDLLQGEEASVLALCDGERFVTLIAAQDHKAAYEGDTGPNTGGMGAYAPAPVVTPAMMKEIEETVIARTLAGMNAEERPFKGVLYAGIMIVNGKPQVLEFNVRFGDPECQPLLTLLDDDLVSWLVKSADGNLDETKKIKWHDGAALCVVLASDGYPGTYEKGKAINGLYMADSHKDAVVFHAGTKRDGDQFLTNGGRVLGVTGRGSDHQAAARVAYKAANEISWDGMRMRRDIGHRVL